jgi:histidinol-phosphate aminotransferase
MSDQPAVEALIRPDIRDMEPYTPILPFEVLSEQLGRRPADIVKLDANENPYGPSPKALRALADLRAAVPIYPDPEARALRAGLADYTGVGAEHILAGAGADELIDLVMRLFVHPGDVVINCPPTFGMYPFDAALNGARVVSAPRRADFSLDVEAVERAAMQDRAKLLFVCSPNNPDGSLLPLDTLERLLKLPAIVVLDEAYIEFAEAESAARRVPGAPNLVVLRTFSKWAGLAGLRVGYGVFPRWMMDHLWKIKQPYNVNVAADAAARASLGDLDLLLGNVARVVAERARLFDALSAIPFLQPYPSRANFVLCRVAGGVDAAALKRRLAEEAGILIRYFNKPGLRDHVRFSVGEPAHTDRLIAALEAMAEE